MNAAGSHVYGGGSCKWLVSPCLPVLVGCGWCQRLGLLQMGVVRAHSCGGSSWMWLAPTGMVVTV